MLQECVILSAILFLMPALMTGHDFIVIQKIILLNEDSDVLHVLVCIIERVTASQM